MCFFVVFYRHCWRRGFLANLFTGLPGNQSHFKCFIFLFFIIIFFFCLAKHAKGELSGRMMASKEMNYNKTKMTTSIVLDWLI